MKTSVVITTPFPTPDEVADSMGVSQERRKELYEMAQQAIANYRAKQHRVRQLARKRAASKRAAKKAA